MSNVLFLEVKGGSEEQWMAISNIQLSKLSHGPYLCFDPIHGVLDS
jgi:hypothetical protein